MHKKDVGAELRIGMGGVTGMIEVDDSGDVGTDDGLRVLVWCIGIALVCPPARTGPRVLESDSDAVNRSERWR